MADPLFVGIDVSRDHLDPATRPGGPAVRAPNDAAGIAAVVARLAAAGPAPIVVEATGASEAPLVAASVAAGLPVAVVNPRQVRDFARAMVRLAKADALDAGVPACFAEAVRPAIRPVPDARARELTALLARRRRLIAIRVAERNRPGTADSAAVRADLEAHISYLTQQLDRPDRQLDAAIRASPALAGRGRSAAGHPGHRPGRLAHAAGVVARAGGAGPGRDRRGVGRPGAAEP